MKTLKSRTRRAELPAADEIKQWEIAALFHTKTIENCLALGFMRRLEAGASIQEGPYVLERDPNGELADFDDIKENGCGGFSTRAFNDVEYLGRWTADIDPSSIPHDVLVSEIERRNLEAQNSETER